MAIQKRYESAIASAALQAAGAVTNGTSVNISWVSDFTVLFTYTRGGAGGSVAYTIEYSFDNTTFFQTTENQSPAIVAGSTVNINTQSAWLLYEAESASAESRTSPTFTGAAGLWMRINAKEVGAVGTPGTFAATYLLQGSI